MYGQICSSEGKKIEQSATLDEQGFATAHPKKREEFGRDTINTAVWRTRLSMKIWKDK